MGLNRIHCMTSTPFSGVRRLERDLLALPHEWNVFNVKNNIFIGLIKHIVTQNSVQACSGCILQKQTIHKRGQGSRFSQVVVPRAGPCY